MHSKVVISALCLYFFNQFGLLFSQICNIYGTHYRIWPWNRLILHVLLVASDPLIYYVTTRNMMRLQYNRRTCFSLLLVLLFAGMTQTLNDQNWSTTFLMFISTCFCIFQHFVPRADDLLLWQRISGLMLCDVWLLSALYHGCHAAFVCCILPAVTMESPSLLHAGLGLSAVWLSVSSCVLWALVAIFLTHRSQLGVEARRSMGGPRVVGGSGPGGSGPSSVERTRRSGSGVRGPLHWILARESGELRESLLLRAMLALLTFTSVAYVVVALGHKRRFGFLLAAAVGLISENILWSHIIEAPLGSTSGSGSGPETNS